MKGVIDVCAIIRLVEMLYGEEQNLKKQTTKDLSQKHHKMECFMLFLISVILS